MEIMTDELHRCPIGSNEQARKPCCEDCMRRVIDPNYLHKWIMGAPKQIGDEWQCELRVTPWK